MWVIVCEAKGLASFLCEGMNGTMLRHCQNNVCGLCLSYSALAIGKYKQLQLPLQQQTDQTDREGLTTATKMFDLIFC